MFPRTSAWTGLLGWESYVTMCKFKLDSLWNEAFDGSCMKKVDQPMVFQDKTAG